MRPEVPKTYLMRVPGSLKPARAQVGSTSYRARESHVLPNPASV